jgi:hypothetical protein
MGFFDMFRRPAPIRDGAALADFIDRNAAFVVQKGIYEYARARAGHYAKAVFREAEFQAACDRARWTAYPLGLAMVAEVVDGALDGSREWDRETGSRAIRDLALGIFDRYPVPAALGAEIWQGLRADLDRRLQAFALHPPKRAMDVPEPYAAAYFDLMPIHKDVRTRDAPTTRNYLRVTLCNVHAELTERVDRAAVAGSLGACPPRESGAKS